MRGRKADAGIRSRMSTANLMRSTQDDAMAWLKAEHFLRHLRANHEYLKPDVYIALRKQAISGDIDGAMRGLGDALLGIGG